MPPWNGNNGDGSCSQGRPTAAMMAATATGMKLRGVHSNSSSSTASSIAAIGVPNTVGHAGRGAGDQQRLALGVGHRQQLARSASRWRRRS